MSVMTEERYHDQIHMYEEWKDMVETNYYTPLMMAWMYLRQVLPKIRKAKGMYQGKVVSSYYILQLPVMEGSSSSIWRRSGVNSLEKCPERLISLALVIPLRITRSSTHLLSPSCVSYL